MARFLFYKVAALWSVCGTLARDTAADAAACTGLEIVMKVLLAAVGDEVS